MKPCIACAEEIQDAAKLCKHCGTRQDDSDFFELNSDHGQAAIHGASNSPKRLSRKQLVIAASFAAALVIAGGTYGVMSSIQQQREEQLEADAVEEPEVSQFSEQEELPASTEPEEPPSPAQDWFCLEPGLFGILATCETRVDNDEDGLYWYLNLVCFDDGTTSQWVDASTTPATRGSQGIDWLPWADASEVSVRVDDSAFEWPISVDNDSTSFTFRTASSASESAWDFLSAIAPAQFLGIEIADANGQNRRVDFPVSGSTTVAAIFSANGCSSSGPR